MIEEPVIHEDLYSFAEIAVMASSIEEALEKVGQEFPQFRIEEMKRLTPEIREIEAGILYQRIE